MNNTIISFIKNIVIEKNIVFSNNEKFFLNFLENSKNLDLNINISELASQAYVSKATITRFSKKLGFSGFNQLKYKINEINSENIESVQKNTINISNSKVFESYLRILSNTPVLTTDIKNLIKKIDSFDNIYVMGIGSSGLVASEFAYILTKIGIKKVHPVIEHYQASLITKNIKSEDLLICISVSGKNSQILKFANDAKENGTVILSISSAKTSNLRNISDYYILTGEYKPDKNVNISKMIPILVILDLISTYYLSLNND